MADDYRAERLVWRPGTTEFPAGYPSRRQAASAYRAAAQPQEQPTEQDAAQILGFGVGTLPADVLKIILKLLAEAGRWKLEANAADRHRHHLEDLADSYPGLPCLNAHAFLRDLDGYCQSGTQIGAVLGYVFVLHIAGVEAATARYGIEAGDYLAHRIFETLSARVPKGDPMACLGYGAYAIAAPDIEASQAEERLTLLLQALRETTADWQGEPLTLSVDGAIAPIVQGQSAAVILHEADEKRLEHNRP